MIKNGVVIFYIEIGIHSKEYAQKVLMNFRNQIEQNSSLTNFYDVVYILTEQYKSPEIIKY